METTRNSAGMSNPASRRSAITGAVAVAAHDHPDPGPPPAVVIGAASSSLRVPRTRWYPHCIVAGGGNPSTTVAMDNQCAASQLFTQPGDIEPRKLISPLQTSSALL